MNQNKLDPIPEEPSDSDDDIEYYSKQYTEAELLKMFGFKPQEPPNEAQIKESMQKLSENFIKMMEERGLKR